MATHKGGRITGQAITLALRALEVGKRSGPWVLLTSTSVLVLFVLGYAGLSVRTPGQHLAVAILLGIEFVAILVGGVVYLRRLRHRRPFPSLQEGETLRALLDATEDAVYLTDPDGIIRAANEATCQRFGLPSDDIVGRNLASLIPEELREAALKVRSKIMRTGQPVWFESERDGGWYDNSVHAIFGPSGKVTGFAVWSRDVTLRHRAAVAAEESEERYRLIAENTADVIWTLDVARGRFTYVSPSVKKLKGFTPDEIMARPFNESLTPESRSRVEAQLAASLASIAAGDESNRTGVIEVEELTKGGGTVPTEVVATALSGPNGEVTTILGVTRDRRERQRAELALRESEERYRSLFEQSPIGIYRTTPDGRILLANPALLRMLGYDRVEDLLARNLETTGFEPDYPRARFKELLERHNEVRNFETHWTTRAGEKVWVIENALAIRDVGGRILYYEGAVEDITARKRAEEAQQRLAAAVEQGDEAVVITDPNGTIEYVNPAFERITGYNSAEAVGQTPRLLKSGVHDEAFYQALWGTITAGEVWTGHLINRRKDGSTYEEETVISPVRDGDGKIVNFVAVKRDVTQEVALRQQLNQVQKMDAIGRLAGGVAHDFNNVLQAMLAQIQLLSHRYLGSGLAATVLQDLEDEANRGASLTRQLLLFSRRGATRIERLDLNEVVQRMGGMVARLVPADVAIELETVPTPLPIDADRGQMDQVIMNLAVNAAQAMPDGGRLRVQAEMAEGRACLVVADTGAGIPDEILDRIFDPFFTTKAEGKGTGLGLSVVHGIVTAHGGTIEVASKLGAGTTFRVLLPSAKGVAAALPAPPAEVEDLPSGAGERILVVEDERGTRESLSQILESLGYQVAAFGSATEAGTLPEEPAFDMILTDLMLPDARGTELAESLAGRWPNVKVILMSGYPEDDVLRQDINLNRVRFLQKPFNMTSLAREIRASLDGKE